MTYRTLFKAEYAAAFARVRNPANWKYPIDATITVTPAELATITEAIEFFTATPARVGALGAGRFRITAPGYYAGPAN